MYFYPSTHRYYMYCNEARMDMCDFTSSALVPKRLTYLPQDTDLFESRSRTRAVDRAAYASLR